MKHGLKARSWLSLLALFAALCMATTACNFSVPESGPGYPPDLDELYGDHGDDGHGDAGVVETPEAKYLQHYFGITLHSAVTTEEYIAALTLVQPERFGADLVPHEEEDTNEDPAAEGEDGEDTEAEGDNAEGEPETDDQAESAVEAHAATVATMDFGAFIATSTDGPGADNGSLTGHVAVEYAVAAANMQELAGVYTQEKTDAALNAADLHIDEAYAAYFACALDIGLIDAETATALADNAAVGGEDAAALIMAVADFNGTSRNFIGWSSDPAIYALITNQWEQFEIFDDELLSSVGAEAVMNEITTGYNLKSDNYEARFLPELTIRYGHSNIKHARQILGLLASEGIVVRLQYEPKISIFKHMDDWGEPTLSWDPIEGGARQINENLVLIYATEYDLAMEFQSEEDLERFDTLILEYAKKNDGEEGKALLAGSWWQPLYYTHFDPGEGYFQIVDNVITNGHYSLHPFCLEEDKEEVLAAFLEIEPDLEIEQVPIWCDAPFYRYLTGESHQ